MKAFLVLVALSMATAGAETVEDLLARGDALDARFETRQALDIYLKANKLEPGNPEILQLVAKEYGLSMNDVRSKDEKRVLGAMALDFAKQAVAADAKNANAQLALSISYGRLAELSDNKTKIAYSRFVKQHAERALALDPTNDLPYYILGEWNYGFANLNPVVRTLAGAIYGELPAASNEAAIDYFRRALKLKPDRIGTRVGLGRALAARGDVVAARKELEVALSMPNREKDDTFAKTRAKEALEKL